MAGHNSNSLSARASRWRGWVQTAFLAAWLTPYVKLHGVCGPVFHCYACPLSTFACPIGVLANFSALHVIPYAAIGTLVLVGGLVGGFVCGWACPFGFLQDLLAKVPGRKLTIPSWTGHLRYAVLAGLVIVIPFLYGEGHPLFFCRLCPAGGLEGAYVGVAQAALGGKAIVWPNIAKTIILILMLGAMFVSNRPWCGTLCPLGAIHGLFNRMSAVYLKVDRSACSRCGLCRKTCRYGVNPEQSPSDPRCIRCLECTCCDAISVGHLLARGASMPEQETAAVEPAESRKG